MVDQCIPELQKMENELDAVDGHGTRRSVRPTTSSHRDTFIRQQTEEDSPIMNQSRRTPKLRMELQTPDDRDIDLNQLEIQKMKSLKSRPHSRNKTDNITAFNSTPATKFGRDNSNRDSAEISVQAYRPKRNPGTYYNAQHSKRKVPNRNRHYQDNNEIDDSQIKEAASVASVIGLESMSARKS